MTEEDILKYRLSAKFLKLMQNEKIPFENKQGTMDYLIKMGADVNAKIFGKTMAVWAKELGDEKAIQYVKENNGKEEVISKGEAESLSKQFWDKNEELKSFDEVKNLVMQGANLGVWLYVKGIKNQVWIDLRVDEIYDVVKILPKGYVINGDVDLKKRGLTELPDFSNVIIDGNFVCSKNKLTSLEGAPRNVGRNFNCEYNQLKSLRGVPSEVGGSFICSNNKLTSLEGGPEKIGGAYWCSDNLLTSLEGAPQVVEGNFHCKHNKLTSLKGKPKKILGEFIIENEVLKIINCENFVVREFEI